MLGRDRLLELHRSLGEEDVLSVYVDVDQHDPAERSIWRRRLEQEVNRCRHSMDADPAGQGRFDQAWSHVQERLARFAGFIPQRGWVGFATADRLWYAEDVPVPMRDGVYWEKGMRVAPFVRALKQERPLVAVLLDSERARVFRYLRGEATELEDLVADTFLGDLTDADVSKRPSRTSGVRGATGRTARRGCSK